MTKEEALKMCLEYIETNAHERRHVRWAIKDALAQPEERNFCQRCGKRTADLTTIHTCTPPQTIADEHIAKVTSDIDLAVNKALVDEDDDIQDYKKPWVGLRAEEIEEIQDAVFGMKPHYVALARAVEAKLKEKNT